MNRLTSRTTDGRAIVSNFGKNRVQDITDMVQLLCEQLAEYEDTGLTPQEVSELIAVHKKFFDVLNADQRGETYTTLDFGQRVKTVLLQLGKTQADLSKQLGISQANFFARCKTGKFTFAELHEIAGYLGCQVVIKYVFDDGTECTGDSAKAMIRSACKYAKMTFGDIADNLGKSRQTFSSKLKLGRFTDGDLSDIAGIIGCKYVNYFQLEDGTCI